MKALWAILISGLLSFSVNAQNGTTNPQQTNPQQEERTVPAKVPLNRGDLVFATLSRTLDAAKASAGDQVLAAVSSGDPTVIGGAQLIGHIASVQRHTDDEESTLVIVFDKALLKDGKEIPFSAVITQVVPQAPAYQPRSRGISTMEPGGLSAHDRAAGPMTTPSGKTVPAARREPSVMEMQADRAHLSSSAPPMSGFKDLYLKYDPSGSTLMSPKHNVKLGKGVTFILRYIGPQQ